MSSTHIPAVRTSFTVAELDGASVEFSIGDGETQIGTFSAREKSRKPRGLFIFIEGSLYTRKRINYYRICLPRYPLRQADADRIQRAPASAAAAFVCYGINPPIGIREVREITRIQGARRQLVKGAEP